MTDIVCKCGTSRLEDIQCAVCGEYFKAGWIPVSERLPETTGEVWIKALGMTRPELGSYVYQNTGEAFGIYCKPCFYVWRAGDWTHKVIITHWMPLPPPPPQEAE